MNSSVDILIYILRRNTFFYCAMTIYIRFLLFKSNRVSFENNKSRIFVVLEISKQTVCLVFHNLMIFVNLCFNIKMRPFIYYFIN